MKRYAAWATEQALIVRNPATVVKLIPTKPAAPRQLNDNDEAVLVRAVTASGRLRNQTMIVLMLHMGLRAREVCTLQRAQVMLGKRSGRLTIYGKRNKYREVPLNATARTMLRDYLATLPASSVYLFPSDKTGWH